MTARGHEWSAFGVGHGPTIKSAPAEWGLFRETILPYARTAQFRSVASDNFQPGECLLGKPDASRVHPYEHSA